MTVLLRSLHKYQYIVFFANKQTVTEPLKRRFLGFHDYKMPIGLYNGKKPDVQL